MEQLWVRDQRGDADAGASCCVTARMAADG